MIGSTRRASANKFPKRVDWLVSIGLFAEMVSICITW